MGFQQALSGLNAASRNLEVIGNNVANSNTVGFKGSQAQFADAFANALSGGSAVQIGIGTNLSAVAQRFTQGNITITNNPLDMAINGQGFFRLSQGGAASYTRNGQFHTDAAGFIVNASGQNLTGYNAAGGVINPTLTNLQISTANIPPRATGSLTGVPGVVIGANLSSADTVPAFAWPNPANNVTPATNTYNFSTATTVYDSLGQSHAATFYFVKGAAANTWNVYTNIGGTWIDPGAPAAPVPTVLNFNAAGTLASTVPAAPVTMNMTAAQLGNGAAALSFQMDYAQMTQYGSAYGVNTITQNGYATGQLTGFGVAADGTISGRYTNGQTQTLGQAVLANFANAQGLRPMGNNQFQATTTSGAELVGIPGSASLGSVQSASTEDSNVDMTAELVNMITAQRAYQANAQTIKTQDSLLQTIVSLR